MTRYAIVTDLNRCVGCLACSTACKTVNGVKPGDFWLKTLRIGPNPTPANIPEINVGVISFVDVSEVTFNKLTDEQIDEYVKCGECMDKAGAYAAQGKGAALIQQIDGNLDTVIGLPVQRMLKDYGEVFGAALQSENLQSEK